MRSHAVWTAAILALSFPAVAQAPVQWTAIAKKTAGNCGDGAKASVTEMPQALQVKLFYPNGTQYADFQVALAADGTGKAEFRGNQNNPTLMDVTAGKGKRELRTTQLAAGCRWSWQ